MKRYKQIKSYKKGGPIGYTSSVSQPIAPTVSQNPTTPGKLDPQEQAAIQRRLYELQNSQQMYQRPTDYRTPAEKQYYEQKRVTELEKEGLTPEGYPTGRTKVNRTLDPVAGLIEKGIDASVVYDAGLLGAKGLRTLAKKVGSKISIPRGYTGPRMTDMVPLEPTYPTSPYRPPGGRTFPVLPARTPTGMPTLVDVPELTKEQQILKGHGLNYKNNTTTGINTGSNVTPLSEYQFYGNTPTGNTINNLTNNSKYPTTGPRLTGQDIEDLVNEKLQKGYGIKKVPQKISVKYEKGNPYSHMEEPEHTFRINVEGRGTGSIGLKKTNIADHNISGVDHPIYEKVADYPYSFGTNTKVTNGSGVSGEVNKALTDVLQEQGKGHLYSSNKHTEQGFNRWENLVSKGKAERITEGELHDYYDPFAEETIKTSNARYRLLQPIGIGAGLSAAALSQQDNKQYGGTINNNNMKTGGFYQKKGMYWDGTKMVKAKGSGTYDGGMYYQQGGQTPTAFWNLPNPTDNPGAEGMVDYGSMYSLPNRGLFQKQTATSEWEGFGNPANLITNQQQQPTQSYQAAGQPLQYATENKSSFYEGPGENSYSIDDLRKRTVATGGLYMGNRVQYGKGGIHIKKANEGKFTEWAQRHDMGVQEAARHVMANKEDYSSTIVKRANFAKNAAGWNKQYGGMVDQYEQGGIIKRADGSYSQRGLWDNIRANAGSGKQPTKEMLEQERKIKAADKRYGGMQYGVGGDFSLSIPTSPENETEIPTPAKPQNPQQPYNPAMNTGVTPPSNGAGTVQQNPMWRQGMTDQEAQANINNRPSTDVYMQQFQPQQKRRPFGQGFSNFTNAAIAAGGIAGSIKSGRELQQFGIKNGMTNLNPTAGSKGQYNQQGQLLPQFQPPARYGKHGGRMPAPQYKTGGTYTVSASELMRLKKAGYDIEELG